MRQWFETWLDTVRAEISPKAHERYEEIVRVYLLPTLGNFGCKSLPRPKYRRRTTQCVAETVRRWHRQPDAISMSFLNPHSPAPSNRVVIARNPADAIRAPRIERKEMTTLTVEQSAQLLASIRHKQLYWPVLLALTTGMRRGEILSAPLE